MVSTRSTSRRAGSTSRSSGSARRRWSARLGVVFAIVTVAAGVTLAVHHNQAIAAPMVRATPVPPPTGAQRVYLRDCSWCHGTRGQGSQYAPSLRGVGAAAADFQLSTGRMPLRSPSATVQEGPPVYSSKTILGLSRYVASFGGGPPIPGVAPGDVRKGQDTFVSNCAPCHSSSGTGMILPNGVFAPELYGKSYLGPHQVAEAIRLGPGPMPSFSEKDLNQEELDDVVSYVTKQLGAKQVIGGDPIDQFGPIIEGAVAWMIPVPILIIVIILLGKRAPKPRKEESQ